jgi:anti-anti-sigma factor
MHYANGPVRLEYRLGADPDGAVRLTLLGEVDIAVTPGLEHELQELEHARLRARLDLSELGFIDLGGLDAILAALDRARRTGWELEVEPCVNPTVARIVGLTGVDPILWPAGEPRREQGLAAA